MILTFLFKIFFFSKQEIKEEIRQRVRDVDQTGRNLNLILSKIHQVIIFLILTFF